MTPDELEQLASILEANPNYRVTRRLVVRDDFLPAAAGAVALGAVVDTETTGTNQEQDKIIEFGAVVFEYVPVTGEVVRVIGTYSGLEDPGFPIPPETTEIHGITDAMVVGKRIDDAKVNELLANVAIVIAHNAIDRPFLERRLPVFAGLPWACSMTQIDWKAEGFGSVGLEFLAYRSGFFFDAHRSEIDCRALLEIIHRPLPSSGLHPLAVLHEKLNKPDWRVYATGAAFETKDLLKARGYRWDAAQKLWHQTLSEDEMRAEINWLKEAVYRRDKVNLDFEFFDALTRFSERSGKEEASRGVNFPLKPLDRRSLR